MRRRARAAQVGVGYRPAWLYVALPILLLTMAMGAWLASLSRDDVADAPVPVAVPQPAPAVVYESFHETEAVAPLEPAMPALPPAHGIALIVDDMGYNLDAARRVLQLPYPVAVSVLPFSPFAEQTAQLAHKAGREVLVHLPMEPGDPVYRRKMDRGFLRADMSEQAVRRLMASALARVPFAVGVNNHMGSRLTSLPEPMRWVMRFCRERALFFVDSRTSKRSLAAAEARAAGIRWGERRVFLDHRPEPEAIRASWQAAKRLYARQGSCIVIAHPYGESLRFLENMPAMERRRIVPVNVLLHKGDGA